MQGKRIFHISILMLSLVFGFKAPLHGQNERFKALFIYNFTKHILWPGEYNEGDFVIGVLGTSPILNELNQIAARKTVNGQHITIQRYTSPRQIGLCHVLYIPNYNSSKLDALLPFVNQKPVVIITDDYPIEKGKGGINFVMKEGFLDFEISKENLLSRGLLVNPKLFSLGNENE